METRAYNESYLSHAMGNLAAMFDYGINCYNYPSDLFFNMFITSGIARQFEMGNPKFLVGHSGIELADIVVNLSVEGECQVKDHEPSIGRSPEFWAGWVMAYYQWKSCRSFSEMQRNGLNLSKVISMYHPLHEADLDKFVDVAESIVTEHVAKRNSVKEARERMGMTQNSLAAGSGVSLRMIRAYEQKKQELDKAEYGTVIKLARALKLPAKSLIE